MHDLVHRDLDDPAADVAPRRARGPLDQQAQLPRARAAARASSSCPLASITVIIAPANGSLTAARPPGPAPR
jgi:hypothetical protein